MINCSKALLSTIFPLLAVGCRRTAGHRFTWAMEPRLLDKTSPGAQHLQELQFHSPQNLHMKISESKGD